MNGKRSFLCSAVALAFVAMASLQVVPVDAESSRSPKVLTINLPTALRLAGARNIDIQLAREKLAEAYAAEESAMERFFPWLAPGVTYRRHDNLIQNTEGLIEEVHKQSYAPGGTVAAQTEIGDAIFNHSKRTSFPKPLDTGSRRSSKRRFLAPRAVILIS